MIPSGSLTYTIPVASARTEVGGDAFPSAIGSLSNYISKPDPYTNNKIEGFHWDERVWSDDTVENWAISLPVNWDASPSGIPDTYFQPGIGSNDDLLLTGVELIPSASGIKDAWRRGWVPVLKHGWYYDHKEEGYLFSDDSEIAYVVHSGIVPSISQTFNSVIIPTVPKVGVPMIAEQFHWNETEGKYEIELSVRKRVEFTGIKDPVTFERASTYNSLSESILYDNVDTAESEFVLGKDSFGNTVAIFNGQFSVSGTEIVSYGNGSPIEVHTGYAPIDSTMSLSVQTYMPISGVRQSWTPIVGSGIPVGYQVAVDYDMGLLSFGDPDNLSIPCPPSGHAIEVGYWKTLRVEWEPESTQDEIIALEANLNPVYRRSGHGFVYLSNGVSDPASIELEARLPELAIDSYGPLYIGNNIAPIIATVKDKNGIALEDQVVTFYIRNRPGAGTFGSAGLDTDAPTDEYGQAKVFYVPPRSIDEIGQNIDYDHFTRDNAPDPILYPGKTQVTRLNTNTLSLEGSLEDIYLYEIYTNDPIQGLYRPELGIDETTQLLDYYSTYFSSEEIYGPLGLVPGTTTPTSGAIEWESAHRLVWNLARPKLFTGAEGEGKRVLASVVRGDMLNPHTFAYGAVGPFQPIAVEIASSGSYTINREYNVVYDTSTYKLPVPSGSMPFAPSGELWGYMLVAPTIVTLQASVINERTGETILSNEITVQLKVPPYLSGVWEIDAINQSDINEISALLAGLTASGQRVPLGFRLRSSNVTLAGALDGVTFLDIN